MNGLAGPLHGLANQEVLVFLKRMTDSIGLNASPEVVKKCVVCLFVCLCFLVRVIVAVVVLQLLLKW